MKVKELVLKKETLIYDIINYDSENVLEWTIEPSSEECLYNEEAFLLIKAFVVRPEIKECFLVVNTPGRIVDYVLIHENSWKVKNPYTDFEYGELIFSVPDLAGGNYDWYYARKKPQVGIDILENGLKKFGEEVSILEDLAYILRDEKRFEESLSFFLRCAKEGPSSPFIYSEISDLYKNLGDKDNAEKYQLLFNEHMA